MSKNGGAERRLYLHVGHAKTGTSYLQSAFWGSRAALANSGLLLPLGGPGHHFGLALALRGDLDESMDAPMAFTAEDRLVAQLSRSNAPRALVTHEVLAAVSAAEAARFCARIRDREIHIVLTVRDLRRQVPAEWQQRVKTRSTVTYEKFLDGVVNHAERGAKFWRVQDTFDVAERWRGGLPADRVHIVTTPPAGSAPTLLLERFCSVLGVDPDLVNTEQSRRNESLGAQQVELMRRVNVALGDRLPHPRAGYNRVAKNEFANAVLAAQGGARLELPASLDAWCAGEAQRIVDQIRSAGYDVVGDLDDLLPPVRHGAGDTPITDELVAASAVDGIAALLVQRDEDVKRIRTLERQLRESSHSSTFPRRVRQLGGRAGRRALRAARGKG
jgi:hypothetical protein